jgi:hypothetical protein
MACSTQVYGFVDAQRLAPALLPIGHAVLTRRSAIALARAVRTREVSTREVVEAHIEVLERMQPQINALAVERFGAARAEADAADARIAAARRTEALRAFGGWVPPPRVA